MTISQVIATLNQTFPLAHAEDFDNVGLLVGDSTQNVTGILVTLDTTEEIIEEALSMNCNLIVSFHPIIFNGIKKITGQDYVQRIVIKALKADVAIFAIHTALDNHWQGVNQRICSHLELDNKTVLIPKKATIKKLVTYVPENSFESLREALFKAGAGAIGNYSHCSFSILGEGSFVPEKEANPKVGTKGKLNLATERQLHLTYDASLEEKILNTLHQNHPYEEVAYEVTTLNNINQKIGMGMVGRLKNPMAGEDFLEWVKTKMQCSVIRHSKLLNKKIETVAVLGGSGAFAIPAAKAAKADAFVTSDLKYHNFFEAENSLVLLDIGHYESEQFTKNLLVEFLREKFANFAVNLSKNTNPIHYYS